MPRKLSLLAAALFAIAGFAANPAYADLIPTHGAVVHLNPFVPPDPPSAVPGATGAKVLPFSSQVRLGADGLFAPASPGIGKTKSRSMPRHCRYSGMAHSSAWRVWELCFTWISTRSTWADRRR